MNATTSPLFIKSAKLAATCLSLAVFQLTSAHAQWDQEYLGSEMAASPWVLSGSNSVDGTAIIFDGSTVGEQAGSNMSTMDGVSSTWSPVTNYTLEFTMAVTAPGVEPGGGNAQSLWAFAGNEGDFRIHLNQTGVSVNATGYSYAGTGIDGSLTNTYRLVVEDAFGSLYINDSIAISNIAANAIVPTYELLWVGDYGSGVSGVGRWEAVRWNNTTAIPEPSAAALLFGVFAAGVALRRRRA